MAAMLDRFGQYDPAATIYIGPAEAVPGSGTTEGDGPPSGTAEAGTTYWDSTNDAFYVYDAEDGWKELIS